MVFNKLFMLIFENTTLFVTKQSIVVTVFIPADSTT